MNRFQLAVDVAGVDKIDEDVENGGLVVVAQREVWVLPVSEDTQPLDRKSVV
jgi:hypothetical protein